MYFWKSNVGEATASVGRTETSAVQRACTHKQASVAMRVGRPMRWPLCTPPRGCAAPAQVLPPVSYLASCRRPAPAPAALFGICCCGEAACCVVGRQIRHCGRRRAKEGEVATQAVGAQACAAAGTAGNTETVLSSTFRGPF